MEESEHYLSRYSNSAGVGNRRGMTCGGEPPQMVTNFYFLIAFHEEMPPTIRNEDHYYKWSANIGDIHVQKRSLF